MCWMNAFYLLLVVFYYGYKYIDSKVVVGIVKWKYEVGSMGIKNRDCFKGEKIGCRLLGYLCRCGK